MRRLVLDPANSVIFADSECFQLGLAFFSNTRMDPLFINFAPESYDCPAAEQKGSFAFIHDPLPRAIFRNHFSLSSEKELGGDSFIDLYAFPPQIRTVRLALL